MRIRISILLLGIQSFILYLILGGYGLFSLQELNHRTTTRIVESRKLHKIAQQLQRGILSNRRFEKDLFLNACSEFRYKQQDYLRRFDSTSNAMNSGIDTLGLLLQNNGILEDSLRDVSMDLKKNYNSYVEGVRNIAYQSFRDTTITASELNQLMRENKEFIYSCESTIETSYNNLQLRDEHESAQLFDLIKMRALSMYIIAVICSVVFFIIILWHRKRMLAAVQVLGSKIAEFASGSFDLSKRIIWKGNDEISTIASDLNKFMEKLQEVYLRLAESEENLRITLNSIGDAVIVTDSTGRIMQMNPVAEHLTGWSEEESHGLQIESVLALFIGENKTPLPSPFQKVLSSGVVSSIPEDTTLLSKEGSRFVIEDSIAPIFNPNNDLIGTVMVFRDVSKERELVRQIRQSEKMDAIGKLAGGIAHDFNNSLGGIMGMTDILLQKETDPQKIESLNLIVNASERAASLNKKLLAFSRKGKNYSTSIQMHEVLNDAVQLLQHSIDKQIHIITEFTASSTTIIGDPAQIQNAIINLGVNSRDAFGGNKGSISIRTKNISLSSEFCKNHSSQIIEPGLFIQITVEDDGCGMDPETIKHIFEPFFTTKEVGKGTGLGLAAVFGIVQDHEGIIMVSSEPGNGTRVDLYLPIHEVIADKKVVENNKAEPINGKGIVLVIDDEEFMRSVAVSQLTNAGYTTISASNGMEGLDLYKASWREIDVVLLDMIMPVMNGRDCLVGLKKINPDVKVIMCTGFSGEIRAQEMREKGAKAFIEKPYRIAELTSVIHTVLLGK